ncbi:Protein CSF1 [Cyberlindnera fabianii]|uniref:Protein CSF1 n=1 Tax=Cyberlindnera fabianii TaxID=36022 RepID=A0A1V2L547_CYBFA|nr:Protein CSF1 [Cyberlindnera fabianii]
MVSSTGFESVSISRSKDFSWVFFSDWLLTFFLTIGFIFYLNRVFGFVITQLLHTFFWRTRRIKLDIQSIKISPVGGRLFFKNFTYVDKDQTVSIVQGTLTWRYWLFTVRKTEKELMEKDPEADLQANSRLPCRWLLELSGLEIFMYNRTVSYDNLMSQLNKDPPEQNSEKLSDIFKFNSDSTSRNTSTDEREKTDPVLPLLQGLPLHVKVSKGALVAGNKTTHSVLVASWNSSEGYVDAQKSSNNLDMGRQTFNINFEKLILSVKPNIMFQEAEKKEQQKKIPQQSATKTRFAKRRWLPIIPLLKLWKLTHRSSKLNVAQAQWKGLSQYLDNDTGSISEIQETEHEYGKYSTLLDSESLSMNYYYDCPGLVPNSAPPTNPLDGVDVGNGGSAPKFGIDISVSAATIHYGPWAERQRNSLHQLFFPAICRDAEVQRKLEPGALRVYTKMDFNLNVVDDLIVRIPMREVSKNEEFLEKHKDAPETLRPFGWLELKAAKDSTASVMLAQVASNSGYSNGLDVSLKNLELRTSVNHDILFRCEEHTISADLGYPLKWDGPVAWGILNESHGIQVFLLREHVTLISDLLTDFGGGPATSYDRFRPFTYDIFWKCSAGYKLYFNINDANIVNNPLDFNDNIYLSLEGQEIIIKLHVPMDDIVRTSTTVDYTISTPGYSLVIDTPPWHTLNNFLRDKEIGRSKQFTVDGSYTYYSEIGLDLVDTVIIACRGKYVALECYGFVVKYIMSIKENYFGDFTSFKTLEEYTRQLASHNVKSDTDQITISEPESKKLKRTENETDVHFTFCVEDSCVILPSNVYDCESNTSLHFGSLDIDIRFTNYYMDMQVNVDPAKGYFITEAANEQVLDINSFTPPDRHDVVLDGLKVHGHRMFGLPPDEPTSFCKWDITPGDIIFDGSSAALAGFIKSFVKLGFGYKNLENHLLLDEPQLFDTTNVSVTLPRLSFTVRDEGIPHIIKIDIVGLFVGFIDFTNSRYIKKITFNVDEIRAQAQSVEDGSLLFELSTSVKTTNFCQSKDYPTVRAMQNEHILNHDGPFHRLAFFVDDELKDEYNEHYGSIAPSMSLPDLPPPLKDQTIDDIFDDMNLEDWDDKDSTNDTSPKSDFFQDFDSHSSERSSSKRLLKETIAGIHIKPVLDYDDSDFCPINEADSDYETDNFVINFGEAHATVCSDSLLVLLGYADRFQKGTLKSTLDDLQIAVLKKLYLMFNMVPSCKNLRFVSPSVSIVFSETSWSASEPLDLQKADHIRCTVESPSMAATFKTDGKLVDENTLALHVLSLKLFVKQATSGSTPLSLILDDMEVWSDNREDSVSSISVQSIAVILLSEYADWLSSYTERLVHIFTEFNIALKAVTTRLQRSRVELLYQVARASTSFTIEHDPHVITRPAYIMRLSRQHIRANDSWKVIARLRHILQNSPADWIANENREFSKGRFTAPENAMQTVLDVFTQWRSWEFTDIVESFVFRYVFSSQKSSGSRPFSLFELGVSDTSVSVISPEGKNYVHANFIELSSNQRKGRTDELHLGNNVCLKVSSVKGLVSPVLVALKPFANIKLGPSDSAGIAPAPPSASPATPQLPIQFSALVEEVNLKLSLGKSSACISSSDVMCTALAVLSSPTPDVSFTYSAKYLELDVSSSEHSVLTYAVDKLCASFLSAGDIKTGLKTMKVSSAKLYLGMDHQTEVYARFLADISEDISKLLPLLDTNKVNDSKDGKEEQHGTGSCEKLPKLDFTMNSSVVVWKIRVCDPVILSGKIENTVIELVTSTTMAFCKVSTSHMFQDVSLGVAEPLLHLVHDGLGIFTRFDTESRIFDLDLQYGKSRCITSDVLSSLKVTHAAIETVEKSVRTLQDEFTKLKDIMKSSSGYSTATTTTLSHSSAPMKFVLNKLTFSGVLFAVSAQMGSDIFTIQLEKFSLSGFDLVGSTRKPYGSATIQNTKILVHGKDIPDRASVVFDFNVAVKVDTNEASNDQSLQIESKFLRVILHPVTLVKFLQLAADLRYVVEYFSDISIELPSNSSTETSSDKVPLKFASIHMLSYDFCVGFIFDSSPERMPGVTVGCEKMFFIAEENIGKFSIVSAFFSIANGTSYKNFYSLGNEAQSPNRAFLPNVQITYYIKKTGKNKDVDIRVTGEELDVKFLSTSVLVLEQLLKSITTIETLRKKMRTHPTKPIISVPTESYKLPTDVTSIRCNMNFAGGVVKLYRWEELNTPDDVFAPSFQLKAPAVQIATEYSKISAVKDHTINVEVFTFTSINTLYSSCVPVLYEYWHGVKELGSFFGSIGEDSKKAQHSTEADAPSPDPLSLLSKFHINFALHIDKQELSLSCEPSAKVQAVVGIDGIDIRFFSNDIQGSQTLSGVADIKRLGASLQHSYSREVSGSVGLDNLLVNVLLSEIEDGSAKLFVGAKMSKVKSYINLKQMQDLDLFRDLWFPKPQVIYGSTESSRHHNIDNNGKDNSDSNDNLVFKYQKASATSPLAWTVDFLVEDVDLQVDLGKSLGVLSLQLDNVWAASRKKSGREQDLLIGFNTVTLKSVGRFSGHLIIKDIRVHSVIRWSLVGDAYDVPLVLLSSGFNSVETRCAFDFNVFLLGKVDKFYVTVFNQVDPHKKLQDKLVASVKCESLALYATTFAAANIMDVYNIVSRIRQDTKKSYKEDLKKSIIGEGPEKALGIIDMIATLRTELDVNFGRFLFHAYPGYLLDTQVLVVDIGGLKVSFAQNFVNNRLTSNLNLRLMNINVALSNYRTQLPEESLTVITVDEFVAHSANAKGGGIFFFPSWECSMETIAVPNSREVKYNYRSVFDGKVEIRWNLGSISFIREMWTIHARALASRLQKNPASDDVPLIGNENIQQKILETEMSDRYIYLPLTAPVIDAPQLRDLGDATPPLEWFGLHRQNFPRLTHQYVIVGLQKMVREVEEQYGHVLGRASN